MVDFGLSFGEMERPEPFIFKAIIKQYLLCFVLVKDVVYKWQLWYSFLITAKCLLRYCTLYAKIKIFCILHVG